MAESAILPDPCLETVASGRPLGAPASTISESCPSFLLKRDIGAVGEPTRNPIKRTEHPQSIHPRHRPSFQAGRLT